MNYSYFKGKICCMVIEGMGLVIGKVENAMIDKQSVAIMKKPRAVQIATRHIPIPADETTNFPIFGQEPPQNIMKEIQEVIMPELIGSPTELVLVRSVVIGYIVVDEKVKEQYTSTIETSVMNKKPLLEVVK